MRISELAATTGVSLATVKYYLREGLLHPGTQVSRTQAEYDTSHADRLRLVRALLTVGGLSVAAAQRVIATIEDPDTQHLGVLAAAQRSLPARPIDDMVDATRARAWVADRGWLVDPDDPELERLETAWLACDEAGLGVDDARMGAYAAAVEEVGRIDVASVPEDPAGAVRQVVLGTVLVDPVLASLRRLAQQHAARSERS